MEIIGLDALQMHDVEAIDQVQILDEGLQGHESGVIHVRCIDREIDVRLGPVVAACARALDPDRFQAACGVEYRIELRCHIAPDAETLGGSCAGCHELLTRIAIAEKRLEDVVSLHQRMCRTRGWRGGIDIEVATALAATHPDIALAIRQRLADELIAQVKPSAYEGAAGHLRAMRDIYVREKRLVEWEQLITRLRTEHRAKRRLLQVLDTLSAKRIV